MKVLEHLSYVMECVLIEATGEAKTELDRLINLIVSDPTYVVDNKESVISQLREALHFYRNGEYRKASGILSSAMRTLWEYQIAKGIQKG